MAHLEGLRLQGIRSFGCDDIQKIKFNSPLTVILGRNGCGKTTIIEALKYACTGQLPSGQGAVFVRDPKLDRQVEALAQVKLMVRDVRGREIVVTKSLQATQKSKKLEVKTIDGTIQTKNSKGELANLSVRCADMDEFMILALGVSKPILSNVIFCHQEDSHWPLEENRKVKERFDEIFDATKYNKCLEQIRILRKKYVDECREHKVALKFLEQTRDTAVAKRRELAAVKSRCEEAEKKINSVLEKLKPLSKEYDEWERKQHSFNDVAAKSQVKKGMLDAIRKSQEELRMKIKNIFTGTQEELEEAIRNFASQLQKKQGCLDKVKNQLRSLKDKEEEAQQSINQSQKKMGQLQAEEKLKKERCEQRNALLAQLAHDLGLPSLNKNADESEVKEMVVQVEQALRDATNVLEKLRIEHTSKEKNLQSEVDECRDAMTKLKVERETKLDSIKTTKQDLLEIGQKLSEVDSCAERLLHVDGQLDALRCDLEEAEKSEDVEALTKIMSEKIKICKNLENRQGEITEEVKVLQKHSSDQKELQMKEEKKKELEGNVRRLRSKNEDGINRLLKDSADSRIKYDLEDLLRNMEHRISKLNQQLKEKERDIARLEMQRKHKKEELQKWENELQSSEESFYELCGRQEYDAVLADVDEQITKLQDDKGALDSSQYFLKRYIQKLQQPEPCCPLCHRGFDDEPDDLILELSQKISSVPARLEEAEGKLSKLRSKQRKLLELKPKYEKSVSLRSVDIPRLKKELGNVEGELDVAQQEVALIQADLTVPVENESIAKSMKEDIVIIDSHQGELRRVQREIDNLKAKLHASGSARSVDEAITEQQSIQKELQSARKEKDTYEQRLNHYNAQINRLRNDVNAAVAEQLEIQKKVQQRVHLQEQQNELSALQITQESELKELKEREVPTRTAFDSAEKALSTAKSFHHKAFETKRNELQNRKGEMVQVSDLMQKISQYEKRGIGNLLSDTKKEINRLNEDLVKIKDQINSLSEQHEKIKEDISSQEIKERELEDNLALMQKDSESITLREELDALTKKLGNMNYKQVIARLEELWNEIEKLKVDKNQAEGSKRELEENVRAREHELAADHLKNAEKKYNEKLIQLRVKELVEKDLQKYFEAMDWAMMHFHRERMNSINCIIREYWRLIYRGNDIDFIEIKTDESTTSATSTAGYDKRRIYNYRVVQVKNGTEIDMRSRCSAGQKVLASLIIRMALAETFSTSCGILTLDEPTTNLDKENIVSLCNAIIQIVQERLTNKNFQLIVITHDHEFLNLMKGADFLSHYYEVSRNHQGKSQIVCRRIE